MSFSFSLHWSVCIAIVAVALGVWLYWTRPPKHTEDDPPSRFRRGGLQ